MFILFVRLVSWNSPSLCHTWEGADRWDEGSYLSPGIPSGSEIFLHGVGAGHTLRKNERV
jgi:hypothetical protein